MCGGLLASTGAAVKDNRHQQLSHKSRTEIVRETDGHHVVEKCGIHCCSGGRASVESPSGTELKRWHSWLIYSSKILFVR